MPSKSKTKGNKFENDIVKFLNETFDTKEFSRTPNSGAIMGRTNWGRKEGLSENVKRTLGSDIIVSDDFPFAVECKHYKDDPNYAQIIKGPDTKLNHWLAECIFDAINLNLHPLLFFKTNRKGTYFALPFYFMSTLNTKYSLLYDTFVISGLETFRESATNIKTMAMLDSFQMRKSGFFQHDGVQELLKCLEEKK